MGNNQEEVIDLTASFTLADHCALSDLIIDLDSDQSFNSPMKMKRPRKKYSKVYTLTATIGKSPNISPKRKEKSSSKIGDCPICWDEIGKNPLASTKCGHVFCLKCLEHSLQIEKRCPTCRGMLRGKSAYHPLYLTKD